MTSRYCPGYDYGMYRIFGIETEYGLSMPGGSPRTQVADSGKVIEACDIPHAKRWDYALEDPRADLRGFHAERLRHDPVDAQFDGAVPSVERTDRILCNGARFYNDHGHPEYATPECSRLLDLVAHDRAGERIALGAAKAVGATLYKNNSDYSGASYGTHENYLVPREVGYERLVQGLLPLLVCRQLFTGAGKVGCESGRPVRYQLSQRADFMAEVAGVDTLYRRPIFNTRDEPHADPAKWIRLHVICGDANRSEWATAMKAGMVLLALDLIEQDAAPHWRLSDPVQSFSDVSRDEDCCWKVALEGGSWTTAKDILESYFAAGESILTGKDAQTDWVISEGMGALADLSEHPLKLADRADWAAKRRLLDAYAADVGRWDQDALRSVEMEYHDVDSASSLFDALTESGAMRTLVPESRIRDAMTIPPDTRAKARGDLVASEADRITAIGWRRALVGGKTVEFEIEGTDSR